jgi:GNAT superfamily N-acetyltransferase
MHIDELRRLYDTDQRQQVEYPDARREVTPHVVRHVDRYGTHSAIIYSQLTAENADEVIAGEIAYFKNLGHDFEWKWFSHDTPADLQARLAAHGFEIGEEEAILLLPLVDAPAKLFETGDHTIRKLSDPAEIQDIVKVETEVWGEDRSDLGERLAHELRDNRDQISLYVAYMADIPVSCAWVRFTPGSQFASLWGGSTLEAYRGRGLYKALLGIRAQEARQRGVYFLTVDASPMSRPILERLGFVGIALSSECLWLNRS